MTQSSWTPHTPTPDDLFQWNKLVAADVTGPLWRNRLEILANCWQKQLRMCLGTHFPVYWTLLSCAALQTAIPSVSKMLGFSQNVHNCVFFSLVSLHACRINISSTRVFLSSHNRQGPTLAAQIRSVQTADQTEHWEGPQSCLLLTAAVRLSHLIWYMWRRFTTQNDCGGNLLPHLQTVPVELAHFTQTLTQKCWLMTRNFAKSD